MANTTFNCTTTSQVITEIGNAPKILQITNMGTNPVTIRFAQSGNAVYWQGIILPFQYATFSFDNRDLLTWQEQSWPTSCISSGGASDLAIFYI